MNRINEFFKKDSIAGEYDGMFINYSIRLSLS